MQGQEKWCGRTVESMGCDLCGIRSPIAKFADVSRQELLTEKAPAPSQHPSEFGPDDSLATLSALSGTGVGYAEARPFESASE